MRLGVNPEKFRGKKNIKKRHRIVIFFYIPNVEEDYYNESLSVLEACLNSLVNTINFTTSCITLINNNSCIDVDPVVNNYIEKGQIDKYVLYSENRGKVYAIMNEVRGIYESFVTISDADVLFVKGWEKAVFNIFKNFKRAGVVAPLPSSNLAFDHNNSVFYDNIFKFFIKKGKIVSDKDCEIYLEGLGNNALLNRNNRNFNWKTHQYYLNNKKEIAILGAGHFVSTYRTALINKYHQFPKFKFFNGYEDKFIDDKSDIMGYYRLSLPRTYAYHLGNRLDDNVSKLKKLDGVLIDLEDFKDINVKIKKSWTPYLVRSFFFKIIKRILKL